ncbi:MAG TPA: transporter [Gemmatimonadaceae bacterium]|nr:transporter [Gemmatimonadaceae bacterium]
MIARLMTAALFVMTVALPARAQQPYNLTAPVRNLATLFTDLYGPTGLKVDSEATLPGEQPHTAHFNSDFQSNFSQFSTALVGQLVSLPLPSPAAGFTYQFDPSLGVFQRTTQSFGPILADRAETIGARRVSIGFAVQRFTFDRIEGLDLGQIPVVFTHDNAFLLGGRQDVVTTDNGIEARVTQATTFLTVGVTDRLDLSIAMPLVSNSLKVVSTATIQRLGTTNPLTHFFRQSNGDVGVERIFTAVGSATGIGDLLVRVKSTAYKGSSSGLALGVDLRIPTGDEMNLLGTGAPGVQPFAIWSSTYQRVSPHLNASYRWNGSSVLSGNPAEGRSADFPDQVGYAAGAEVSVGPRLTVAFDVLGAYVIRPERMQAETFHALDGHSEFPSIVFARRSMNTVSGAVGFKASLFERLLVDANLLFALDNNGLRDKVTPLIGFEYAF